MAKIWEVNFTNFSGVSNVAFDEVGNQDILTSSGIVKVPTLPNLNFRPGVAFTANASTQVFGLRSSGATNACFNVNFNRRSFVMWLYLPAAMNNGTFFDANETTFWGEWSGTGVDAGIGKSTGGVLRARVGGGAAIDHTTLGVGWHLVILTVDKIGLESAFYVDNVLVGTNVNVSSNTAGTFDCIIGDRDTTRENSFQIGLCSTYDHILTANERQAIYDTFLKDALNVGVAFQSFSGTLYGNNGLPESGATHYVIYQPTSQIVSSGQTDANGFYSIDLPFSGAYTTIFTSSPNPGSRSFPVIATSGGVFFP